MKSWTSLNLRIEGSTLPLQPRKWRKGGVKIWGWHRYLGQNRAQNIYTQQVALSLSSHIQLQCVVAPAEGTNPKRELWLPAAVLGETQGQRRGTGNELDPSLGKISWRGIPGGHHCKSKFTLTFVCWIIEPGPRHVNLLKCSSMRNGSLSLCVPLPWK